MLAGVGFVPLYHLCTTACIWASLGDFAGLSFFFLAPFFGIIAIVGLAPFPPRPHRGAWREGRRAEVEG